MATRAAPRRSTRELTPLTAEDIADAILWAVTRPAHVNIARISLTSVNQANTLLIHREE